MWYLLYPFSFQIIYGLMNIVKKIPELFSFAKNTEISLIATRNADGPEILFHLLHSTQAAQQLHELEQDLNGLPVSEDHDTWSYIWGTPFFSSSKAYAHLTGHLPAHLLFHWLWKSAC